MQSVLFLLISQFVFVGQILVLFTVLDASILLYIYIYIIYRAIVADEHYFYYFKWRRLDIYIYTAINYI